MKTLLSSLTRRDFLRTGGNQRRIGNHRKPCDASLGLLQVAQRGLRGVPGQDGSGKRARIRWTCGGDHNDGPPVDLLDIGHLV